MNNIFKNKLSKTISVALLSVSTSMPINAATYEVKENAGDNAFNLKDDFSGFEMLEAKQKLAMAQVKNNYLLVLELVNKKQYKKANTKVTAFIKQYPNQSIYYNLQALLQLVNKDLKGAEQSFLKAVNLDSNNSQALTGLAKLALDNKQLDNAKQYADKVLAINPQDVKAYQVLADVAMQQQGIEAVEKLLLDAHGKVKNNFRAELLIVQSLGNIYISKKQPEKLLELASNLILRNKEKISVLSFLVKAQLFNKDETNAEKTLRQIIVQQPNDSKHHFLLAKLLSKQKDKEIEVLKLLDKAALNMDNPALVLIYKSSFLIKQKHYKQAFAIAQQVDQSNPTQSIGRILKGDVYLAEKKYKKALRNYKQAYDKTPSIKVLDAMLKILTVQNKSKDAVDLLETEQAKNKENTAIKFRLAVAYQNTGQYDLSIKQYEALLAKQKDNAMVLNNLAWLYSQRNNPKALKTAEQAYKLAPKSGVVADTFGHILLKKGYKNESLKVLKQAVKLDPKLLTIQLHLAEAYIANQNKPQAKKILQRLLSNEDDQNEEARKLMENL